MPVKTSITSEEYSRLACLLAAAKRLNHSLDMIMKQAAEITGDEPFGHTFDAVMQSREADQLLKTLGIKVR